MCLLDNYSFSQYNTEKNLIEFFLNRCLIKQIKQMNCSNHGILKLNLYLLRYNIY